MNNPFLVKGYTTPAYFCDRVAETAKMLRNIANGSDTVLISPRKYGKSALIQNLFYQIRKQRLPYITIYADIFASHTIDDMVRLLSEAIAAQVPKRSTLGEQIAKFFARLRPTFSYNTVTGAPEFSIQYGSDEERESTLRSLFEMLNGQDRHVVLAIDEFQQIAEYPNHNMEALIRTYTQNTHNISYIFCGSNRTLMSEMFNSAKRPLFQSASSIHLDTIPHDIYKTFIAKLFAKKNIIADDLALDYILNWTYRHTYFTQRLCHTIFDMQPQKVTFETVQKAIPLLYSEKEYDYLYLRSLLTPQQWALLRAICMEGEIEEVTASFITRHNLSGQTTARRNLQFLVEKELLLPIFHPDKKTSYRPYDVFLGHWIAQR